MMGGGSYSHDNSVRNRADKGWASEDLLRSNNRIVPKNYIPASAESVFVQHGIHNEMNPHGVKVRESRDSVEHPESVAIIVALDETGSMGDVPHHLVQEGLPHMMNAVYKAGVKDPQVLFLGIGDHTCDRAPLQVGQFETSDELLDKWLTSVFLEGKGGGNEGESYALAWYFAAKHTALDCLEKRKKKGVLFTIGDEPVLKDYPARMLEALMGKGQYSDETAASLLAKAREKYTCYHIHIAETSTGSARSTIDGWRELMRDNLFVAKSYKDVPKIIADAIVKAVGSTSDAVLEEIVPKVPVTEML